MYFMSWSSNAIQKVDGIGRSKGGEHQGRVPLSWTNFFHYLAISGNILAK